MDNSVQSTGDMALMQATAPSLKGARGSLAHIDKASKDFEGMFMSQMLKPMFDTVHVDPLFGGGHGEEVMRGFMVQEYGKALSGGMNLGIANAVKSEMIKAQSAYAAKTSKGAQNAAIQ